jgi:hypothetical protein
MPVGTVKARYDRLDRDRETVLHRARQAAELTIPAVLPPEGSDENTPLPTPYQSLGARGVNNLTSKMLLALFPPSTSFFRLQTEAETAAVLDAAGATDQIEEALRKMENQVMRNLERGNIRTTLHLGLKHLIITGNGAVLLPKKDGNAKFFRLDQYVATRDPMGELDTAILKEEVLPSLLSPEVKAAVNVVETDDDLKDPKPVEVYTMFEAKDQGKSIEWFQEINGMRVPDSEGRNKMEESPLIVLRWTAIDSENYGRGHVEEYLGDLRSHESLSKSIIQFAAAVSKIIIGVKPNAVTQEQDITEAESGDVITGDLANDVTTLQIDKFAEFNTAKQTLDDLTLRLSHAFLLQSGTVRNAERVTAEEIRAMAQELEDVLGGVYSVQARELQMPVVRRLMWQMRNNKALPALPRGTVAPTIIAGFEALGRGHELNRFRAFIADVSAIVPGIVQQLDPRKVAQRFATAHNVDIDNLFKTDEQLVAEQQQAVAAQVMDKATGPVSGELAKGFVQSLNPSEPSEE